ncbi:MAG: hypothetical protein V3R73_00345, partial [Sphingomonadales bacterium]
MEPGGKAGPSFFGRNRLLAPSYWSQLEPGSKIEDRLRRGTDMEGRLMGANIALVDDDKNILTSVAISLEA